MKKGLHGAPSTATIQPSGLGMDLDQPFLACSPDGLASIPTKESTLPCKADKSKGFFCNLGPSGTIALKWTHDYYQVQGTMAIMRQSWCDYVVWPPTRLYVECIAFDLEFSEITTERLISFYKNAVLPQFALPRYPWGQAMRELQRWWRHTIKSNTIIMTSVYYVLFYTSYCGFAWFTHTYERKLCNHTQFGKYKDELGSFQLSGHCCIAFCCNVGNSSHRRM